MLNNDLIEDTKDNFIPLYLEFTFEFRIVQGMHCYYFEWIQILYWSNQSTLGYKSFIGLTNQHLDTNPLLV